MCLPSRIFSVLHSNLGCFQLAEIFSLFLYYSGESMENALRACCKGIKIGKILIHRDGDNGKQVSLLFGIHEVDYSSSRLQVFYGSLYLMENYLLLWAAYIWEASQGYLRTSCLASRPCPRYRWWFETLKCPSSIYCSTSSYCVIFWLVFFSCWNLLCQRVMCNTFILHYLNNIWGKNPVNYITK